MNPPAAPDRCRARLSDTRARVKVSQLASGERNPGQTRVATRARAVVADVGRRPVEPTGATVTSMLLELSSIHVKTAPLDRCVLGGREPNLRTCCTLSGALPLAASPPSGGDSMPLGGPGKLNIDDPAPVVREVGAEANTVLGLPHGVEAEEDALVSISISRVDIAMDVRRVEVAGLQPSPDLLCRDRPVDRVAPAGELLVFAMAGQLRGTQSTHIH